MTKEKRPLILIVDDVARNLQILGSFLREAGYDVSAVTSGKQALEITNDVHPDLILLDIMMPELDGFETCRRLKDDDATREIPVIFLTAKTAEEDILRGFELGAVDYITKPFQRRELIKRVHVHVELRRSREELARMVIEKDKLFSIIAHDLRGPLGSFMSIADYVTEHLDELDIAELKPLFREMRQTSKSVYGLLENLLDWSRIQLGTVHFHSQAFPLHAVATNVVSVVGMQAKRKELTLENLIPEDLNVCGDKRMISTVLRNLVSNAIKYTPRGGHVTMEVETHDTTGQITVLVRDTGVGMSEEIQSSLFNGLQLHSLPGTEKEKGTGLGLLLCREMIAMHGQKLMVESAIGEGSTFSFSLEAA
ncbi:MAG: hybrid sensor histidine kinase/response regulator [Bacteroidetes bacterium]|nr:hybrid sensor histidine kinase/response regulator [Bacteroidota bacterium]